MPPHELIIKVGAPIMLLRNLNLGGGLCNGTRMIVTHVYSRLIQAKIITGTRMSEKVYIPRILLINKDDTLPFIFKRKQFPVKLCYAMTINKSQGQSLNKIGVYLPEPVFGHGQLYVALSRATSPKGLRMLIKQHPGKDENMTKNVVYKDFLSIVSSTQVTLARVCIFNICTQKLRLAIRTSFIFLAKMRDYYSHIMLHSILHVLCLLIFPI